MKLKNLNNLDKNKDIKAKTGLLFLTLQTLLQVISKVDNINKLNCYPAP